MRTRVTRMQGCVQGQQMWVVQLVESVDLVLSVNTTIKQGWKCSCRNRAL